MRKSKKIKSHFKLSRRKLFLILSLIVSIGVITILVYYLPRRNLSGIGEAVTGKACNIVSNSPCEFYEKCSLRTSPPSCQYNPNWMSDLTLAQKMELYNAFKNHGWNIYALQYPNVQTNTLFGLDFITPRANNRDKDLVSQAITAVYPEIDLSTRQEIYTALISAHNETQSEALLTTSLFIADLSSLITLPYDIADIIKFGPKLINLIKRPKQYGDFLVKLSDSPELVSTLQSAKNPATTATLLEMKDGVPAIRAAARIASDDDTLWLLRVNSKPTRSAWGRGFAASADLLSDRVIRNLSSARSQVRAFGGVVDYSVQVEVAASIEDFTRLSSYSDEWVRAVYMPDARKILINPRYIRYNLWEDLIHETIHQASGDAYFTQKVSRLSGSSYDERTVEAFTEYAAGKISGKFGASYVERVTGLFRVLNRYTEDYIRYNGLENTPENYVRIRDWLDKLVYKYLFTNSYELERVFDDFYKSKSKLGELLRWYFKDISYGSTNQYFVLDLRKKFDNIISDIGDLFHQEAIAATLQDCCNDWPQDPDLDEAFLTTLELSDRLKIKEWGSKNYEALLKMTWLTNKLRNNRKITTDDLKTLSDLDFSVTLEQAKPIDYVDLDSLEKSVQSESKSERQTDTVQPTITQYIRESDEIANTPAPIKNNCSSGWYCNDYCADQGAVNIFNGTWCDGKGRWLWEAAGSNSSCVGNPSKLRSQGC